MGEDGYSLNKKIIKTISFILILLIINQGYVVKAVPNYPNDGPWVTISRDPAYPLNYDKLITDYGGVSASGKDLIGLVSDLINAGQKHIYITDGIYNLNGRLNIWNNDVIILGQSNSNTKILQTVSDEISIKVNAQNFEMANCDIDGTIGNVVFHAQYIDGTKLENCIIHGSSSNSAVSIYGDNSNMNTGSILQGNTIYSSTISTSSDRSAIVFYKQKNGDISNNNVFGRSIGLEACEEVTVTDNSIKNSATGGIKAILPG